MEYVEVLICLIDFSLEICVIYDLRELVAGYFLLTC